MKITTEKCKHEIVKWVLTHENVIVDQFVEDLPPSSSGQIILSAANPNNWKRICKNKIDHKSGCSSFFPRNSFYRIDVTRGWWRTFDCKPFDDQLRADVITDEKDENILYIDVHGE